MKKPIIILGRSCSGKNAITEALVKDYGYEMITTYTTRPMRPGEIQDETYHFRSEEEFLQKVKEGFFVEWKKYDTKHGPWYYGLALEDVLAANEKSIVILTPAGLLDVKAALEEEPLSIYIWADEQTLKERQMKRKDDVKEAERRFEQDRIDFAKVDERMVTRTVINNSYRTLEDVVGQVADIIEEERSKTQALNR